MNEYFVCASNGTPVLIVERSALREGSRNQNSHPLNSKEKGNIFRYHANQTKSHRKKSHQNKNE